MLRLYIIFEVYVNIVVDLVKSGEIRRYRNDHYYYILLFGSVLLIIFLFGLAYVNEHRSANQMSVETLTNLVLHVMYTTTGPPPPPPPPPIDVTHVTQAPPFRRENVTALFAKN